MEKYQQPWICKWYHPNGRKQRGTKEPLDEGKEKSEKAGLKLNIQKTKIIASGLMTSWQVDGKKVEAVTNLIFMGSKITEDGDFAAMKLEDTCSFEEKLWQTYTAY